MRFASWDGSTFRNERTRRRVPYLQKALRLQPDLVEASSLLGTAYVRIGQLCGRGPKTSAGSFLGFLWQRQLPIVLSL